MTIKRCCLQRAAQGWLFKKLFLAVGLVVFALGCRGEFGSVNPRNPPGKGPENQPDPSAEQQELIEVETYIYRYQFTSDPDSDSTISDADIVAAFDVVNEIWAKAKIRFNIQQISDVAIPASILPQQSPTFTQIMGLDQSLIGPRTMASLAKISQPLLGQAWNVGFVKRAPSTMGGGTPGNGSTFYFEQKSNGAKTDIQVIAHEIGHALIEGDPEHGHHFVGPDCDTNLMRDPGVCGGGPLSVGHELTVEQLTEARTQALKGPRVLTRLTSFLCHH